MLNPNFRRRLHTIMLAFIGFCKAKRTRREWQAREWLLFLALFLFLSSSTAQEQHKSKSRANKDREHVAPLFLYSPLAADN
jgi:hypothetical protein